MKQRKYVYYIFFMYVEEDGIIQYSNMETELVARIHFIQDTNAIQASIKRDMPKVKKAVVVHFQLLREEYVDGL